MTTATLLAAPQLAVLALAVLVVLLVAVLVIQQRNHDALIRALEESHRQERVTIDTAHRDERRELATRIQHPHLIPLPSTTPAVAEAPTDADDFARIGTVAPYGDESEDEPGAA